MQILPTEIAKLMNRGEPIDRVANIFHYYLSCGMSFRDILDLPIPLVIEDLKIINKENEKLKQNGK
jgi:hypothetical protein